MSTPGSAETLRDALTKAYKSNPTLTGTRAGQRANDENVPIERSQGLPQVNADGSYTETLRQSGASINSYSRLDRQRVVSGKSVSVRVDLGGSRIMKKKKIETKEADPKH